MRYPEQLIKIMREDLTKNGVAETRTPEEVDKALLDPNAGTVMMVVNSVCGCAAGKARPGVVEALKHKVVPQHVYTVFAGGDVEATARVRELATGIPPSSPSVYLFREGKPIWAMHRHQIEGSGAFAIAETLKKAFEQHCAPKVSQ
ncbi:MAG TPA: BrxA/BrxB family bacilliredoxin [Bryobacteraceae bacterium]|nr:BrxA/BrxB family bacilliredoxin [Bryobacteraceae bacterium]